MISAILNTYSINTTFTVKHNGPETAALMNKLLLLLSLYAPLPLKVSEINSIVTFCPSN
jgi:hypothetical protein